MAVNVAESDTREMVEDLNRLVAGEVRFDKMSRALYATDASIYQIEPVGVVLPRSAEDVVAVVETANRYGVSVLPRGGGTSLGGQTVGESIVMDFSKYMNRVLEVNAEERWVRTQPGIVLDVLNHRLRDTGLLFAPDPSTSNRGNVGGALGNNSCGAHSVMWGKTVDNVRELDVVLSNGDPTRFGGALDGARLEALMRTDGLEGDIYRRLFEIGETHRDEIIARYPKIQRRVSGYNLDEFTGGMGFDMARFAVGSEGTLVSITEANLKLVPRPKVVALGVLHCNDLIESMEATVAALDLAPAAVELIGSMIIRQAKSNLAYSRITGFIEGDPEALLVIEMAADDEREVRAKLDTLGDTLARRGLGYAFLKLTRPEDQEKVWDVRKAGLGLMMNVPGDAKPLPFVEDCAVSPERLPDFVRKFDEIVSANGTEAGYYGHASVGCLHIRPLIDLKNQEGVDRMVAIAEEVGDLVLEYGGSMSGEHGDGLVRSWFNRKMFGDTLYGAFQDVKRAFDPNGIMNPGKIVDAQPMTENLRIGPEYAPPRLNTGFAFAQEGGFARGIEMCNGQGACRKTLGGVMCPSFMATREEEHSTRGRANALRSAMSGALPTAALGEKRLYDTLDLCLECKGCAAECPSNVDMAKLKYEFLNQYHKTNPLSARAQLFGGIAALSRWGSFFAPVSNWANGLPFVRGMMERRLGIDRRRRLPPFASQTFEQWFRARGGSPDSAAKNGRAVLFPDTFTNYNHPELGRAAVKVIEALGYQVIVPKVKCCGRPMLSKGMMDKARANARYNVETVYEYVESGAPLVGIEPSCVLSFADEYADMTGVDTRKAKAVAESTMLIERFVEYAVERGAALNLDGSKLPDSLLLHGHCHQKALVGTGAAMSVLKSIKGCEVEEISSGCCGMAGSFGYEAEHYDISMRIGEMSLFPAIREREGDDFAVIAEGVSCRQQIAHGTGKRAKHLVEALAEAL